MGRFAKRFSGERPVSLGFELTFLSEFKRVVWRVLDRTAKRCACISQAPAKEPFEVFSMFCRRFATLEKILKICYNVNVQLTLLMR